VSGPAAAGRCAAPTTAAVAELVARLGVVPAPSAQANAPLGERTTYRVGGRAALGIDVADLTALVAVAEALASASNPPPVLVAGQGSNLLVADRGFSGVALWLGAGFEGWEETAGGLVRVGGAARLPQLARQLARAGWSGFEWAVGVPGSIGGAVRMNAGGHGADMAATVVAATIVDLRSGRSRRVDAAALAFGYRRSAVAASDVVVDADLRLERGDPEASLATVGDIVAWRRRHQPGGANAGSVFTNPPGDSAGRLIDAAGCSGLSVGTAEVSPKHANFIQAGAGGSADDIWRLMHLLRRRVASLGGPLLHPETICVGFPHPFGSAEAEAEVDAALSPGMGDFFGPPPRHGGWTP
jgi:UDP-N-acetylmuramate dehydrogenase